MNFIPSFGGFFNYFFQMNFISFVFLLFTSLSVFAIEPPQVLYTDIVSGPNQGGENNKGAYLSIFGKHLGDSLNDVQVLIGGVEVDNYRYLGPSNGRFDIQQLTVQIGSIGDPQPGVPLPIQINVNGLQSNTDHAFMVQPGNIYFVSLDGDDATGEVNNINKPFRYVQNQVYYSGVLWLMQPGDFLVMREGTYRDIGHNNRFARFRYIGGTQPTGEIGQGPLTITAYPGEHVQILPQSNTSGGFHGVGGNRSADNEGRWITIANLNIEGGDETVNDGPINLQVKSQNWRIVNNQLFNWDAQSSDQNGLRQARAGGISGNGSNIKILGNHIHGIGGGTLNHGIYLDTGAQNVDIAYNHIHDITGGNIIQTYDNLGMENLYNISIHHNWLHDGTRYGLNIGVNTRSLYAWNNVIFNTAFSGIRNTSRITDEIIVFNNTFYNTSTQQNLGHFQVGDRHTGNFQFINNIVASQQSEGQYIRYYTSASNVDGYNFNNNVWFGLNESAPIQDSNAINLDPLFVNAQLFDFRLSESSPATDAGISWTELQNFISQNIFEFTYFSDISLMSRDDLIDIGAYESTNQVVPAPEPTAYYQLSVNQGTGSGSYQAGTIIDIDASTIADKQFDYWTGNIEYLDNISQAQTQLIMPEANISITAVYRDIEIKKESDLKLTLYKKGYTENSLGRIYHYRMYLENHDGPDDANNIVVTIQLPSGMFFQDATGPCNVNASNQAVQCNYDLLHRGYNKVIDFNLQASENGDFPIIVSVDSDSDDPVPYNNTAQLLTQVIDLNMQQADLKLYMYNKGKLAGTSTIYQYRAYIQNKAGPSMAEGVTVNITIPAGMSFNDANKTCSVEAGIASCTIGNQIKGSNEILDFTLHAHQNQTYFISAQASSSTTLDPDLKNNTVTVMTKNQN